MEVDYSRIKEAIKEDCEGRYGFWRIPLLLWFAWIGFHHLVDPLYSSLFGGINLGLHEMGHVLFGCGGEFIMIAGGTVLQCLAPLIALLMFLRQGDSFACTVAGIWESTNLYGVATYLGDARRQELPLVGLGSGDPIHDWHYLLSHLHLLAYDTFFAVLLRILAAIILWGSWALGAWMVWLMFKKKAS